MTTLHLMLDGECVDERRGKTLSLRPKDTSMAGRNEATANNARDRGRCLMKDTKLPRTKATRSELIALVTTLRGQVVDLENALRGSDGTRELLENIQDGILVIDAASHRIREVNPMAATMFGATRDQIQGHECFEFICPAQRGACPVTDLGATVDHAERQMLTRGSDRKPILKTVARMNLGGDDVLVESFMDISDRRQAEDALQALAMRHDALLAAIPEIVMEVDNDKVYTWANEAGKEFFGEDVVGKEASSFFEGEQETYRTVAPVFKGTRGPVYVESWQRRKGGEKTARPGVAVPSKTRVATSLALSLPPTTSRSASWRRRR